MTDATVAELWGHKKCRNCGRWLVKKEITQAFTANTDGTTSLIENGAEIWACAVCDFKEVPDAV